MIGSTIVMNNTKAQALGGSSAPRPGEPSLKGGNEQGIEGLFNIIDLSNLFTDENSSITIDPELRVNSTMAFPNPDNVIEPIPLIIFC